MPSPSVSMVSKGLRGKRSSLFTTPSPSTSVSVLSPISSPSWSLLSEGSKGKASSISNTPSLSSSVSVVSPKPSLSVSINSVPGLLASLSSASCPLGQPSLSWSVLLERVSSRGKSSWLSGTLSPSSSVSALSPTLSPSVSVVSSELKGKASSLSTTPSLSSSVSALSPEPSLSKSLDSLASLGKTSSSLGTPSPSISGFLSAGLVSNSASASKVVLVSSFPVSAFSSSRMVLISPTVPSPLIMGRVFGSCSNNSMAALAVPASPSNKALVSPSTSPSISPSAKSLAKIASTAFGSLVSVASFI